MPVQPRGYSGTGGSAWRGASRLRHDGDGDHRRDVDRLRLSDAKTVLERRWVDEMPSFRTAHFLDGFPTRDRRFHFAPDWKALGDNHAAMPKLPDQMDNIEAAGPDAPFRLVTAPARSFLNTSFSEMASGRRREGRPTVLMHPDDARRLGLMDGSKVRLGNVRGEVILHARISGGQQPGVLVSESIWPSECFEGGIGINALTSDDPGRPGVGPCITTSPCGCAKRCRDRVGRRVERHPLSEQCRWERR